MKKLKLYFQDYLLRTLFWFILALSIIFVSGFFIPILTTFSNYLVFQVIWAVGFVGVFGRVYRAMFTDFLIRIRELNGENS